MKGGIQKNIVKKTFNNKITLFNIGKGIKYYNIFSLF